MNVAVPDFFKQVQSMLGGTSLDDWKTYLTWQLARAQSPLLQAGPAQYGLHLLEEIRDSHVHGGHRRRIHRTKVLGPIKGGGQRNEFLQTHLVIRSIGRIAARYTVRETPSPAPSRGASPCRRVSMQPLPNRPGARRPPFHVGQVLTAKLLRLRILLQIIVAVRQTEAALIRLSDILAGVLVVRSQSRNRTARSHR